MNTSEYALDLQQCFLVRARITDNNVLFHHGNHLSTPTPTLHLVLRLTYVIQHLNSCHHNKLARLERDSLPTQAG